MDVFFKRYVWWFLFGVLTMIGNGACNDVVVVQDGDANIDSDSPCANASDQVIACNDFEQSLGGDTEALNGAVWLDTEAPYQGNGMLAVETTQEGSWANLQYPFTPVNSGTIHFAAMVWIPSNMILGTTVLMNLSGYDDGKEEQAYGVDINMSAERTLDIYIHGNYTRYQSNPGLVPEGEWFCLQGRYSISQVSGEASVWINNDLVVSTTASQEAVITGGVSEFRVGIGWTEGGQTEASLRYDNLIVSTAPVTCW